VLPRNCSFSLDLECFYDELMYLVLGWGSLEFGVDRRGMIWLFADQDLRCEVVFAVYGFYKVAGDDGSSWLSLRFIVLIYGSIGIDLIFLMPNSEV
jgi:hypothetical protein